MAFDLYSVLGITSIATSDEVRRAYYRLVRQHPPEKDPEGFKAIRNAFETLSDARARQRYDAFEEHGETLSHLIDQASALIDKGEWAEAARSLKRVVVLAPEADFAWSELGHCYLGAQNWEDAKRVFTSLVGRSRDIALYWFNLGLVSQLEAEELDGQASDHKAVLCQEARKHFRHAVSLEPDSSQYLLAVARSYTEEGRREEAIDWTERAIATSQKHGGVPDFDALFHLCTIHFIFGTFQEIPNIANRIMSLIPADEEIKRYVGWRFTEIGLELSKLQCFTEAGVFFSAALKFDPLNEDLQVLHSWCDVVGRANDEVEAMLKDDEIIGVISAMVQLALCYAYEIEMEGGNDSVAAKIDEALLTWSATEILGSLRCLRSRYPGCYELNREVFSRLEGAASETVGSSNDCFIVTATFGSPYAVEVQRYRAFRDKCLVNNWFGRRLVMGYHVVGPFLAQFLVAYPCFKRPIAFLLVILSALLPPFRRSQ